MSKNILIFILLLSFLQINFTMPSKNKYLLRTLNPNPLLNDTTKDASDLKFHFKLKQTLYTDSSIDNNYYTILYIGENKTKHIYLIDTTSDIVSSQCKPNVTALKCDSKICDILPSTTCKEKDNKNICSFSITKSINDNNNNKTTPIDSLKGFYSQDIAYLEEDSHIISPFQKVKYRSFAFPLACTTEKFGKYNSNKIKYDGILGINNSPKSFIGLLNKLKIINKNIFSICFGRKGGYMSLGEIDPLYHIEKGIKYMPLLESNNDNLYKIKIKEISMINSTAINYNGEAVIDTTSTLTYFPENIYNEIFTLFNNHCQKNNCGKFETIENKGYCASFEDRETLYNTLYKLWPDIIFNYEIDDKTDIKDDKNNTSLNSNYIWKAINYYTLYDLEGPKKACLSFASHKINYIILGTKFFHGYDIIFNREEKKLGYVKADCSRGNMLWRRGIHNNRFFNGNDMENRDKNGIIRKFMVKFNNSEDGIDFIKGRNSELNFSGDFKFVNFILLLFSIIIVVIVAIMVISFLICNKKAGLRYEEPDVAIESEPNNYDDNNINNYYNNNDDD